MPFGGRRGSPLASALPKPRLCSQGDPPHLPSLTPLPPLHLGFRPPFRRKTLFAFRVRGHLNQKLGQERFRWSRSTSAT